MKLNKRYKRSIRSDLSFYISSTVLTVTTLVLFFIMNIAGQAILDFGNKFFDVNHLEDANFSTYMPISDEDIESFEEKYDITLETHRFLNIETDGVTARVFKRPEKINLYEVTVGEDVSQSGDVVISEGYAVENKVSVGDTVKIGGRDYTVTGFMQRPDYLYMLENPDDSYKNITTFFIAYVTDEDFDALGTPNLSYHVRYNGNDDRDFRKEVNETYFMRSYTSADDNPRIEMVPVQAEMFIGISYIILVVLPLVAVALISIIIGRKVKSEQKLIGTLTALGYKKRTLMAHYAGFAVIPGILGGVLSTILSLIFAQPFGELGLSDYEPMRLECHLDPVAAVIGIVVPTLMYVIAALLSVNKLLKKNTVLLLSGNADAGKKDLKKIMVGKKVSFRIKYALRSLIGNPARTFVVFLGIFLGSFIMLLGFSFVDAMKTAMTDGMDQMGSFEYEYVLSTLLEENTYGGEQLILAGMEEESGKSITIIGSSQENTLLNTELTDGGRADLSSGCYISSVAALISDVSSGDVISLTNPYTMEVFDVTIDGIIANDMQRAVYMSNKKAAELMGMNENSCNVIMSDEALDIPEDILLQTVEKSDSADRIQTMIDQMGLMIWLVIILGAIICIASVYVAVNMLVTENRANISMLKVLGYSDKRINGIVLRVNHILLPIGILVSIPLVYISCNWFFELLADFVGVMINADISAGSYVITIIFTSLCYFGSLFLVRNKVKKVDMVESLKDNRE